MPFNSSSQTFYVCVVYLLFFFYLAFSCQPFAEITNLTDVSEGVIVRTIQRLDEILKDVRNASHIVGDPTLQRKMEDASQLIKRDIVFAASLYTQ